MESEFPIHVDPQSLTEICRRFQVDNLSVFGSVARGQMRADSDVDLLVEFLPAAEIGLIEYAGLMLALSGLLGRKVDLVSKPALRPVLRGNPARSSTALCGVKSCISSTSGRPLKRFSASKPDLTNPPFVTPNWSVVPSFRNWPPSVRLLQGLPLSCVRAILEYLGLRSRPFATSSCMPILDSTGK
ncbi:MAG: nucleotidyltransferase family protein [Bryobacterales bacterium]|nr:nucleotidyltransferase family protein [Bryobacterales bacterium]